MHLATAFAPLSSGLSAAPRSTTTPSSHHPTALFADLTLYGSQGSRSPLVNWAAYELGLDLKMGDLSNNPHPFGQIPCLVCDNQVIFESGAILLYLDAMAQLQEEHKGEIYSWVQWANASLDPICFLETPQGKVYDTGLKDKQNKKIHRLNAILKDRQFLVGDGKSLTVADVAVASYLLYVVQFFPDVDLSTWSNMVRYMKDCVSREAYANAFGKPVQAFLVDKLEAMGSSKGEKKMFGMF
jgi:glutathione S-transferase/alpha,alpha-trehalase